MLGIGPGESVRSLRMKAGEVLVLSDPVRLDERNKTTGDTSLKEEKEKQPKIYRPS